MTNQELDKIIEAEIDSTFQFSSSMKIGDIFLKDYLETQIKKVLSSELNIYITWDQDSARMLYGYISSINNFPSSIVDKTYKPTKDDKALLIDVSGFGNIYRYLNADFTQDDPTLAFATNEDLTKWEDLIRKIDEIMSRISFVKLDNSQLNQDYPHKKANLRMSTYSDFLFSYI